MIPFEYVLPLASVVVGLGVADLAVSLHRLLRARAVGWEAGGPVGRHLALFLALARWRNRAFHAVSIVAVLALLLAAWSQLSLE